MWAHRSATEQRSCLGNAPTTPACWPTRWATKARESPCAGIAVVARGHGREHPCSRVSERARRPAGRPCAVVDETSKVHVRGPGGDDRASVLSDVCSRTDNGPVRRRRSWRCGLTAIDHRRQSSVRPEEASIPASPRIDVPQARFQTYTPRTSGAEVVPKTSRGPDLPVVAGDFRSRPSAGGEQPAREGRLRTSWDESLQIDDFLMQ
jgi:hypothetical protein